ncbi:3'(2'),5'-bisphosphate nucleotidase CysQ family protein, partial [Pseudoalteromonas sp.]
MIELLEPCISLAEQAGAAIMSLYKKDDIGKQEKSDNTPVTKADLAANDVLVAGLKALAPDIPIMSEETPIPALAERQDWQRYWLLDPMDGTGEFILESGDFAVNIALVENNRPVLG